MQHNQKSKDTVATLLEAGLASVSDDTCRSHAYPNPCDSTRVSSFGAAAGDESPSLIAEFAVLVETRTDECHVHQQDV